MLLKCNMPADIAAELIVTLLAAIFHLYLSQRGGSCLLHKVCMACHRYHSFFALSSFFVLCAFAFPRFVSTSGPPHNVRTHIICSAVAFRDRQVPLFRVFLFYPFFLSTDCRSCGTCWTGLFSELLSCMGSVFVTTKRALVTWVNCEGKRRFLLWFDRMHQNRQQQVHWKTSNFFFFDLFSSPSQYFPVYQSPCTPLLFAFLVT